MKLRRRNGRSFPEKKVKISIRQNQQRPYRKVRASFVALAFAGLLAACSGEPTPGSVEIVEGYAGLVAADEPRAAVIGRDVLGRNGTAADAAVAMGLAMTASYPSRVGLGGGGLCVVYDGPNLSGTSISFLPDNSGAPMLARGLALLHARFGSLRWELLVTPAENLARQGNPASRALVQDIADAGDRLGQDPRLYNAFYRDGLPVEVGDRVALPEVAAALSGLRRRGVAYMTTGSYADRLLGAAQAAGANLSRDQLRNSLPQEAPVREVPFENDVIMLPANAVGLRFASLASGQPASPTASGGVPAASFVVADRFGYAVACSFTQNDLFGAGRLLGDTGVILAAPPPVGGYDASMSVALVANKNINRVRYGVAASDYDAGAAAAEVLQRIAERGEGASAAVAGSRAGAAEGAKVTAFRCPSGTVAGSGLSCSVAADPRGRGLAEIAN
jgi:gamma-glutamyltranspeptidase/glutathione hydrolase